MDLKKFSDGFRNRTLVIDFPTLEIFQELKDGLNLNGYGSLSVHATGALACEIVCTKSENLVINFFSAHYPLDATAPKQKLKFRAIDLEGKLWTSENFTLTIEGVLDSCQPFKFLVYFSEIVHKHKQNYPLQKENYIWFQFLEICDVPKNKTNTTDDSLVGRSMSWNQTNISLLDYDVSILEHEDYTTVYANGVFDTENLYSALKFYIGFTSGTMPSAYAMTTRKGSDVSNHIRSINMKIHKTRVPVPIVSLLQLENGELNNENHYDLLRNIIHIQNKFPVFYASTVSQWNRVWQGFNAQQSITALTLSVSIEGLLIDLYIPQLEKYGLDSKFNSEKKEIVDKISQLDIDSTHLQAIIQNVERWGNIHTNKALGLLAEKSLLSAKEVSAWKNLRHSAVHPKLSEYTIERQLKEKSRLELCLTLYYKLNLNIYDYRGGHVVYDGVNTMSKMFPLINIFNLYEDR